MALADPYRELLERLLPPGVVWRRAASGEVGRWLDGFAYELGRRLHPRIRQLVDEADPRTTTEMLAAWERNAGLPDDCAPAGQTLVERRAALWAKIAARGGQSPGYFVGVALALGLTITISEFDPFVVGSACGDLIGGDAWQFAWQVNAPAGPHTFAEAESAFAGCGLEADDQPVLECVLGKMRPAHTVAIFSYS